MNKLINNRPNFEWISTFTLVLLVGSFTFLAFTDGPVFANNKFSTDTIPSNKKQGEKDLDKELQKLDEAKKQLSDLKNKNWEKVEKDIEDAMKKIDLEKIRIQAEQALSKIDMEKIGKEIEESLRKIDFKKIEKDIEAALSELSKIDEEKIKEDIQKAFKEVDEQLQKKEWRKEMEEAKKVNIEEVEKEMEKVKMEMARLKDELKIEKLDLKETMTKAHAEIEKAKEELKGFQDMIYLMEKDGLLNTQSDYSIEYNKGELSINGKKQPTNIADKYKSYFKKDKLTILKQGGDLKINND